MGKMLALVVKGKEDVQVEQVDTPVLTGEDEVIIQVKAVALNPTDWKHTTFLAHYGAWLGMDFSGLVLSIGSSVSHLSPGDRVAGYVHGGMVPRRGSFAEQLKTEASLVWKIPEGTDWEEAAAMGGIGTDTAVQVLYRRVGLEFPWSVGGGGAGKEEEKKKQKPILIWGAASSVGMYSVQLAKLAGLRVIVTCSPKNNDLLRSLGADDIYDYRCPSTPSSIRAAYPDLSIGFDTITEGLTTELTAQSLGKPEGGKVYKLMPWNETVSVEGVSVEYNVVHSMIGKGFKNAEIEYPADPKDRHALEEWLLNFPELISKGKLKPNPLRREPGGLRGIVAGLELLKQGKISAEKVTLLL